MRADSPVSHSIREEDGTGAISLDNSVIGVELWPQRGAKVGAIVDRRTGRNWLSVTDRPWGDATTSKWQDSDISGWDECLPNIATGVHPAARVDLPDHGEVWQRPWTYEIGSRGIRTRIDGNVLPYSFVRDIELVHETLVMKYRLENLSHENLEIGWAIHLLADIPFSAVHLADDTAVRVDSTFGACGDVCAGEDWTTWGELAAQLANV